MSVTTPPTVTTTPAPLSTAVEQSTTTSVETTATLAPDATPPELLGEWTTTLDNGDVAKLILRSTTFIIDRRDLDVTAGGRVSVEGDTIEFSLGEFCQGTGAYTWVLEGETLTLTLQGVDECGRSQVLDGRPYTFLAPLP